MRVCTCVLVHVQLSVQYDMFQREKTIIINGFKNVGIVDALKELPVSHEGNSDPFEGVNSDRGQ